MNAIPFDVLLQWGPNRGPHGPMWPHGGSGAGVGAMPWGGAWGGGGGLLWVLPTLVVALALLVGGASLLLRLREREETRDARDVDADEGAVSVLRARYARGEIDDDEFDRRRARLEGGRAPPESSS